MLVMGKMNGLSSGKQDQTPNITHYKQPQRLKTFVCANVMLIYEVTTSLDATKTRIVELEVSIDTIKEDASNEFRKEATTTK